MASSLPPRLAAVLGTILLLAGSALLAQPSALTAPPSAETPEVLELAASADSWIDEGDPLAKHGASDILQAGHTGTDPSPVIRKHLLVRFPDFTLPPGSTVLTAELHLFQSELKIDTVDLTPQAIITEWDEETVSWSNQPDTISFLDPRESVSSTLPIWMAWQVTGIVRGWVDGIEPPLGILLWGQFPGKQEGIAVFRSRDYADQAYWPHLVITYQVPAPPTATRTSTPTEPPPTHTSTPTLPPSGTPAPELGDAPDSLNHVGMEMKDGLDVAAYYPTVYDRGAYPHGPKHINEILSYYLGASVTWEQEADLPPDQDPTTNLVNTEKQNQADLDLGDDGLKSPVSIQDCAETVLTYKITKLDPGQADVFLNIWFDSDRSGVWGDTLFCDSKAGEWILQNLPVHLPGPGLHTFTTAPLLIGDPYAAQTRWLRISVSDKQASSSDGSGPVDGYPFGETEDYMIPATELTPTPTATPTGSPTPTSTPSPTATPTSTPTSTASPTPTATVTTPTPVGNIGGTIRLYGSSTVVKNALVKVCYQILFSGWFCVDRYSDVNGRYLAQNLEPGEWTVSAGATGCYTSTTRAWVNQGRTTTVDLYLRERPTPVPTPDPGAILGQVLEYREFSPVPDARIDLIEFSFTNPNPYSATTYTNNAGEFTFLGVPPGGYIARATAAGYTARGAMFFTGVTVTSGEESHISLTLAALVQPIPSPVPSSDTNLTVHRVLQTQAVQRWDNSLPLAADIGTYLRVFVDFGGRTTPLAVPVQARLFGSCLPAYGLSASASPPPVSASGWAISTTIMAALDDIGSSLNFELPPSCTHPGTRSFTVTLTPRYLNPERNVTDNSLTFSMTFHRTRALAYRFVPYSFRTGLFCAGDAVGLPPSSVYGPMLDTVRQMYPTRVYWSMLLPMDFCWSTPRTNGMWSVYLGWWSLVLQTGLAHPELEIANLARWVSGDLPYNMAYGVVPTAECAAPNRCGEDGRQTNGLSLGEFMPWAVAGRATLSETLAHEPGHALGRPHASNDHQESGGGSWERWFYTHGSTGNWGLQKQAYPLPPWRVRSGRQPNAAGVPVHENDIMSYGNPRWISDWTWNHLFDFFHISDAVEAAEAGTQAQPQAPVDGSYLLVMGTVSGTDFAQIGAMRPLTATSPVVTTLPVTQGLAVELYDAGGLPLPGRQYFAPWLEEPKGGGFSVILPYPPEARSVAVITGSQVLTSLLFSTHAPTVTITAPSGGEVFADALTLKWEAGDADGDPLVFDLSYSPDGGDTWVGIDAMLTTMTRTVDLRYMPGGTAVLLRVLASDGVNTGVDYTDGPVVVPRKPPQAIIERPAEGEVFGEEDVVILQGNMLDTEDGPPWPAPSFVWLSSRDGLIGFGDSTNTIVLSPGRHHITLQVTDSDGLSATASVNIVVGNQMFLPVLMRQ